MPRIAVVGAGIAGLGVAATLSAGGVEVVVYEQASELGEVGAGVSLIQNSLAVMERLDLLDQLDAHAVKLPKGMVIYDHEGNQRGASPPTPNLPRNVHRVDLVAVLRSAVPAESIVLGRRATSVTQDETGATVHFADAEPVRFDGVVGADGIHSVVRASVDDESTPVFSGMVAYRGLIAAERMPDWPLDECSMFTGLGRHFLVFPVRSGTLLNFVAFVAADEQMRESWTAPGDPTVLAQDFSDFPPHVREFISKIERTFQWGLYDREPLSTWANGRVALAGDAAHAMLPHAGQGANQCLEDAAALGALLSGAGGDEIVSAFQDYDLTRRARGSYVQLFARRLGREYDGDWSHTRRAPGQAQLAERPEVTAWIATHDVYDAANRARHEHVGPDLPIGAPI